MDKKVVEAKIDEVLNANNKKTAAAKKDKQESNPFGGDMTDMGANPFAAFAGAGMGDMPNGKVPLKMRIMTKLAGLAMNPTYARFLQKKWWPLWIIVGILFSGFIVVGVILFFIWKLLKAITRPYADLFKKRS